MAFSLGKAVGDFLIDDPAIDHIDFHVGLRNRLHIDAAQLREVGRLIKSGVFMKVKTEDIEDAAGEYDPDANSIHFDTTAFYSQWNGSDVQKLRIRSLVVHEATHAVVDMRQKSVLRLRNEAAAYLAGAVFLHHHDAVARVMADGSAKFRKFLTAADRIADREGLYTKRGVRLTRRKVLPLIRVLKDTPPYDEHGRLERSTADGLSIGNGVVDFPFD